MVTRVAITLVGWLLTIVGVIGLLGWVQSGDPECKLDTGIFAQIRMCDPAIVGEPQSWSLTSLAALIAALILGVALLSRSKDF